MQEGPAAEQGTAVLQTLQEYVDNVLPAELRANLASLNLNFKQGVPRSDKRQQELWRVFDMLFRYMLAQVVSSDAVPKGIQGIQGAATCVFEHWVLLLTNNRHVLIYIYIYTFLTGGGGVA